MEHRIFLQSLYSWVLAFSVTAPPLEPRAQGWRCDWTQAGLGQPRLQCNGWMDPGSRLLFLSGLRLLSHGRERHQQVICVMFFHHCFTRLGHGARTAPFSPFPRLLSSNWRVVLGSFSVFILSSVPYGHYLTFS